MILRELARLGSADGEASDTGHDERGGSDDGAALGHNELLSCSLVITRVKHAQVKRTVLVGPSFGTTLGSALGLSAHHDADGDEPDDRDHTGDAVGDTVLGVHVVGSVEGRLPGVLHAFSFRLSHYMRCRICEV